VLYTRTAIERRGNGSLLPSIVGSDVRPTSGDEQARYAAERALDQILADSFPASDPPSWTLGVARPEPVRRAASVDARAGHGANGDRRPARIDILDVSLPRHTGRPFLRALASLVGAAGIALVVPFVILLVGLPIALVIRGFAEAIGWLLARLVG
jgi:hypothetical protein